jgi:hypothetical protein
MNNTRRKMNKKLFLLTMGVAILLLAACSANSGNNSSAGNNVSDSSGSSASLSQVNQLLVGSLKLEDTDQAITADQAATLLPLWQAYRSLSSSQTSAEAEVDALLKQIESSMTSDQMKAIQAMDLTNDDLLSLMQALGPSMQRNTPDLQATPGIGLPGEDIVMGNPPGGSANGSGGGNTRNFPSGGGTSGSGQGPVIIQGGPGMGSLGNDVTIQGTPDPSIQSTAQARFSTQASQVNTVLLNVLIDKLQAMMAQ